MKAFKRPLAFPAIARPLPAGTSAIQLRLIWWVRSKSETARAKFGEKHLPGGLPTRPMFLYHRQKIRRVTPRSESMDFEYV